MRRSVQIPKWVYYHQHHYNNVHEVPGKVFDQVNARLATIQNENPTVSVIIPAWNEEISVLNCISSLSSSNTSFPLEIVVIDNNSSDATSETLKKLNVKRLFQPIQGCGPARQLGQEHAKGKYVLLADADCLYPPDWVEEMINGLMQVNVVCVYGRYSFLPTKEYPRWKLRVLEILKDAVSQLRHFKRPYLNAYGMSMGYIRSYGLEVGFVDHNIRGEDGRMCFDLMTFGNVRQIKAKKARVWTPPRTIQLEGGFSRVLYNRIKKEFTRLHQMFKPMQPHDTRTSKN